jgi:hypothetical protein
MSRRKLRRRYRRWLVAYKYDLGYNSSRRRVLA